MNGPMLRQRGWTATIALVGLCVALSGAVAACGEDDPSRAPLGTGGATSAPGDPGDPGDPGTGTQPGADLAALLDQLRNGTRSERAAAADALGMLGDPEAVPALVEALADESWDVRAAAAGAFLSIPDERAVDGLLALIAEEPATPAIDEADLWVARGACDAAVEALGGIGDVRAAPRLVEIAMDAATGLDTERAAAALEAIGEAAVPAVTRALGTASGREVTAAVSLLARLGDAALDPLLDALRDKRLAVRIASAEALAAFGRPAVKGLMAAAGAGDDDLRAAAARSLGTIGDGRATGVLVDLLSDPGTRRAGVAALVAIHRDDASPLVGYLKRQATVQVYRPLIRIGQGDTVSALVTALERFGSKSMGETYLNCGEPRLEKAAKRWAASHGYVVIPSAGAGEEVWGDR